MACFSYLAPEYLSTGVLDDKCDVYSFGILIMEIVSGKTSIEYTITEIEVYMFFLFWHTFILIFPEKTRKRVV